MRPIAVRLFPRIYPSRVSIWQTKTIENGGQPIEDEQPVRDDDDDEKSIEDDEQLVEDDKKPIEDDEQPIENVKKSF